MRTNSVTSRLFAFITIAIWSATFVSSKVLLSYFSPTDLHLIRLVIALLFSELLFFRITPFSGWRAELILIFTALTGSGLYQIAENYALLYSEAANVSLIVSTAPMLTIIISRLLKKVRKIGINFIIGFILAISGIALISFKDGFGKSSILGFSLAFFSALCWALYTFGFELCVKCGVDDRTIVKRMFFYSILFVLPFSILDGKAIDFSRFMDIKVILNLIFLSLIAQSLAFLLWGKAIKALGGVEANVYIYLVPAMTQIFSIFFLGEKLTGLSFAGIVLVLVGLSFSDHTIVARFIKK